MVVVELISLGPAGFEKPSLCSGDGWISFQIPGAGASALSTSSKAGLTTAGRHYAAAEEMGCARLGVNILVPWISSCFSGLSSPLEARPVGPRFFSLPGIGYLPGLKKGKVSVTFLSKAPAVGEGQLTVWRRGTATLHMCRMASCVQCRWAEGI